MQKTRETLFKIIIIIIISLICIFTLEVITRVFMYIEPVGSAPIFESDDYLCFKLKSGLDRKYTSKEFETHITTNELGFREEKSIFNRNTIAFFGDSFTFGSGVNYNETYVKVTEDLLNLRGYMYYTYNFGVGGYGTVNQRKLLEEYIGELNPEIIIVSFYTNDARDNFNDCIFDVDEEGHLIKKSSKDSKIKKWFQLHSNLYRNIALMISNIKLRTNIFDPIARNIDFGIPIDYKQYLDVYDKETEKAWNITYDNLNKINEISRLNNAEFIILYIPSKSQVDKEKEKRIIEVYNLENADFRKVNKNLLNFSKENGVHLIDLTETFIKKGGSDNYYPIDAHWKAEGHKLAAKEIVDYLIANDLI